MSLLKRFMSHIESCHAKNANVVEKFYVRMRDSFHIFQGGKKVCEITHSRCEMNYSMCARVTHVICAKAMTIECPSYALKGKKVCELTHSRCEMNHSMCARVTHVICAKAMTIECPSYALKEKKMCEITQSKCDMTHSVCDMTHSICARVTHSI